MGKTLEVSQYAVYVYIVLTISVVFKNIILISCYKYTLKSCKQLLFSLCLPPSTPHTLDFFVYQVIRFRLPFHYRRCRIRHRSTLFTILRTSPEGFKLPIYYRSFPTRAPLRSYSCQRLCNPAWNSSAFWRLYKTNKSNNECL